MMRGICSDCPGGLMCCITARTECESRQQAVGPNLSPWSNHGADNEQEPQP